MSDKPQTSPSLSTWALTLVALTAFAGNSILCRLALGTGSIDAASFTSVRLVSGGAFLALFLMARGVRLKREELGDIRPALYLLAYAVLFSFAYLQLTTGTGALLLFSAVQLTMFAVTLWRGHRPGALEGVGMALAFGGLIWLLSPGLAAPPLSGAVMMLLAGLFWGLYTLAGQKASGAGDTDPIRATARNFILCTPFAMILALASMNLSFVPYEVTGRGLLLAVVSGAVTSGGGYVIWYMALRTLHTTEAAIVQLSVPVLAALGGILFMAEGITPRFLLASALILGGIFLTIWMRRSAT